MKKWHLTLVVVIIVVAIIIASFIIRNQDDNVKYDGKRVYHYEIDVILLTPGNFTLHLPVPIASRVNSPLHNTPTALMNNIEITGPGQFSIITTPYGYAIQIMGNDSVHLVAHREFQIPANDSEEDYVFDDLSMHLDYYPFTDYRIFFNGSATGVNISFSCYNEGIYVNGGYNNEWGFEGFLPSGWSIIELLIEKTSDIEVY